MIVCTSPTIYTKHLCTLLTSSGVKDELHENGKTLTNDVTVEKPCLVLLFLCET